MIKGLSIKLLALAVAFTMVAAACSSTGSTETEPSEDAAPAETEAATAEETEDEMAMSEEPTEAEATPVVDTPASNLTRDLSYLLVEHEYLAGTAVLTAVQAGGDLEDATFKSAAGTLDKNSKDLASAIEGVYGKPAGKQFLDLWRAHIGFFVDYTLGKATNDAGMVKKASKDLDGYRSDFGAFIEGATEGGLPKDAVEEALDPHVKSTKKAIDSVVASDGKGFENLRLASVHMPMIATALAGGIATQQGLEGEADSGAAQVQRDLTYLLVEHEYLAGIAVYMAVGAGGDLKDPGFTSAAAALDENSKALAGAIEGVYGKAGGKQFLDLWRAHIGFFVDYTLGKATNDKAMVKKAEKDLDGYRSDFGAFLEGATEGGLPKQAVEEALLPHVESTQKAIDSVVAGNGKAFDDLRKAAVHMPGIATAIAGAIVTQFPEKF